MVNNFRLAADNPMNRALLSLLAFEVIIFGLSYPVMVLVSDRAPVGAAVWVVLACLLALVSTMRLRKPGGWALAWLTQLAGVALGVLTPGMYVMGVILVAIWVLSFVLGKQVERPEAQ